MMLRSFPFLILFAVATGLVLGACTLNDADLTEYRATHQDCPQDNLRVPCRAGPDGRLYRVNTGS
jgi:hypothetical protein